MEKSGHIYLSTFVSPWGHMSVAVSSKGVCFLGFCANRIAYKEVHARFPHCSVSNIHTEVHKLLQDIILQATPGIPDDFSFVPIDLRGTEFQLRVWQTLQKISYADTATYADVAMLAGRPGSARAVGNAVGANPVSLIIPCHRVVRADASLGGYHWGAEIKASLLHWENWKKR